MPRPTSRPGRSSVRIATATTIPRITVISTSTDRRRRAKTPINRVRFSQPRPTSGTNKAVFATNARPYEVDHTWDTADSSVNDRAIPVAPSTSTAVSATVEKRRATAIRVGSSPRRMRNDVDQGEQAAEPHRRGSEVCEVGECGEEARLAGVECVARERRSEQQRERRSAGDRQQGADPRCEGRGSTAGDRKLRARSSRPARIVFPPARSGRSRCRPGRRGGGSRRAAGRGACASGRRAGPRRAARRSRPRRLRGARSSRACAGGCRSR